MFLNRYPDLLGYKYQGANPSSLCAFPFFGVYLFWIVRCGWAWLLTLSCTLTFCQFFGHSQPRRGGGLRYQKSKWIVVNCDHHFLSASKASNLEVVVDYSTRHWCNVVSLALPIHLEHITLHKVQRVMATRETKSQTHRQICKVDVQRKQLMLLKLLSRHIRYSLYVGSKYFS